MSFEPVLAIDVGASSIKIATLSQRGELLDGVRRIATPYPCSPERLVTLLTQAIVESGCRRVGVGFPGDMTAGRVIEPGNLSRPAGISSDIDVILHERWLDADLQTMLAAASGCDVRVVNDATLAALGCVLGEGRELVFTLGTGLGIALVVGGAPQRIRDVGAEAFLGFGPYDQVLGDAGRTKAPAEWLERLVLAVERFAKEFRADVVHLGGGNSRQVSLAAFVASPFRIVVNDNDVTLRGALRLFAT